MTMIAFVGILISYVAIASGVSYWLTTFGATSGAKGVIALVSVCGFLALAVWDEVRGYVYLRHLCATEGGIKVYRTAKLAPEYWNEDGTPRITNEDARSLSFFDGRYEIKSSGTTVLRWPNTVRYERAIVDRGSGDRLAAFIDFSSSHGWLLQSPGWNAGGRTCEPSYEDLDRRIIVSVFRKAS